MREIKILTEKCMRENIVLDMMYPVGSVYVSLDKDFNPNEWWGGVWELLKEGTFLEATETAEEVGKEIEPGLPNITGVANPEVTNTEGSDFIGAFYAVNDGHRRVIGSYANGTRLAIDASRCSSIYGNSSTVQPKSIRCFIWRRIS